MLTSVGCKTHWAAAVAEATQPRLPCGQLEHQLLNIKADRMVNSDNVCAQQRPRQFTWHSQAVVDAVVLQPNVLLPQHHSSPMLLAAHHILNTQPAALQVLLLLLLMIDSVKYAPDNRW